MSIVRPCGLGAIDVSQIPAAQAAAFGGDLAQLQALDLENTPDREARISALLSDPNTSANIRALVRNPLYGTLVGDFLYNSPQSPTPSWVNPADRAEYAALLGGAWSAARVPPAVAQERPRYLINGVEQYADGTPVPGGYNAQADAERQEREQATGAVDEGVALAGIGGTGVAAFVVAAALIGAVLRRKH